MAINLKFQIFQLLARRLRNTSRVRIVPRRRVISLGGSIFNFQFSIFNSEKGQAVLLVVLAMVVSLTVGLAVISRSIINLRSAADDTNSKKALSAAEAGIDEAIKYGCVNATPPDTGCIPIENSSSFGGSDSLLSFNAKITVMNGSEFVVNGGNPVEADEGADIWLVPHDSNGKPVYTPPWAGTSLTVEWGSSSDPCSNAAIEAIVISKPDSSVISTRYAIDPCDSRRTNNNFCPDSGKASCSTLSTPGTRFKHKYSIDISNGLIVRIVPLYFSSPIAVFGTDLPSQGNKIESTGKSGSTNRKVTVYQGYAQLPSEFFPYVLFTPK